MYFCDFYFVGHKSIHLTLTRKENLLLQIMWQNFSWKLKILGK